MFIDIQERKSLLSYENQLASAIACDSVAATDYVDTLLNKVKAASAESNLDEKQLNALKYAFPEGGIIAILEKNPIVLSKCECFDYTGKEITKIVIIFFKFRSRNSQRNTKIRTVWPNKLSLVLLYENWKHCRSAINMGNTQVLHWPD